LLFRKTKYFNLIEDMKKSTVSTLVAIYSVLCTIVIIFLIWYMIYEGIDSLIRGIVPNILYGLILTLVFLLFPSKSYRLLKEFVNDYNEKQNDPISTEYLRRINKSKMEFYASFPTLRGLWDSFIEDRINEIEQGADGKVVFSSETQRDSFIESIFKNLEQIPNLDTILSMTWDHEGYFPDYWRQFAMSNKFEERNEKAGKCNVVIKRMFIFRKKFISQEKIDIYNTLWEKNKLSSNTIMRWMYEEDLKAQDYERYIKERSSFLLLIDANDNVRILTQNYQLETFDDEKKSNALFFKDQYVTVGQKARFQLLYEQGIDGKIPT